jgi:hypothetical protein
MEAMTTVTLGSVSKVVPKSKAMATAGEMVKAAGGGVPKIVDVKVKAKAAKAPVVPAQQATAPAKAPGIIWEAEKAPEPQKAPAPKVERGVTITAKGKARSTADKSAAQAAGFKPKDVAAHVGGEAARGKAVIDVGVVNAREADELFKAKPTTAAECKALVARVVAEKRSDVKLDRTDAMVFDDATGGVVLPTGSAIWTPRAIRSFTARIGSGGGEYLASLDAPRSVTLTDKAKSEKATGERKAEASALLASNLRFQVKASESTDVMLRTREIAGRGHREVYGVVSPKYAPFDADALATLVGKAVSPEMRGAVSYDGYRTRIEAYMHTTTQPEDFVAGEFFRAGIVIKSDDAGGGSSTVMAVVEQNLCLNLLCLDESWQDFGSHQHRGTKAGATIEEKIAASIANAQASLAHFAKAWGFATKTNVLSKEEEESRELLRGVEMNCIFRGILNTKLVRVPGKTEELVPLLLQKWEGDTSSAVKRERQSVAAVTNAFTALAHDQTLKFDPWQQDEISTQAANLLRDEEPLPWETTEEIDAAFEKRQGKKATVGVKA